MVQTIKEFLSDIRTLRKEMYMKGEKADTILVASWLDRLVISIEKIAPTLDMMAVELDELANAEAVPGARKAKAKKPAKKKAAKKTKKKPAKKAKPKRRKR